MAVVSSRTILVLGLVLVAATACSRRGTSQADSSPVAPAGGLATVEAGATATAETVLLDGVVEAVRQATLSAQTAGRVSRIEAEVGDIVTRGQRLVKLRAVERVAGLEEARAAVAAAAARDVQARAQHDRLRDMYERKVVARATYDEALAARDAATAALAAAKAALAAAREGERHTEVVAPFDGVVTARDVQAGEVVAPGSPLMSVAALDAMRVLADVPQGLAAAVRANPVVTVHAGDHEIRGARATLYPVAQPQSGTFRARIDLPADAPRLAPGTYAKVAITGGGDHRLLVPRTAVVERSELRAVYVVGPDDRVALRQVRLGRAAGDHVEVIAGLVRGERVATDPLAASMVARLAQGGAGRE